jgi:DHA2 family methylenomycin A resistance protein-like MFS transporter
MPESSSGLVGSVPVALVGTASAVLNPSRQLGAVAVAIFGALIANRATFRFGMQVSLLIASALLLVTAAASLSLRVPRSQ